MNIWGEWHTSIERGDTDWPDLWNDHYQRHMRPNSLNFVFHQRSDEAAPVLWAAWASCQKRWKNSRRLTDLGTGHIQSLPLDADWIQPYVNEALTRIAAVQPAAAEVSDGI